MKLLMLSVGLACQVLACASLSVCQAPTTETEAETKAQPDRLHFLMSYPAGHKVIFNLVASSAQRIPSSGETGDVLQLRGNVEVTTITCQYKGDRCGKSPLVLHADEVDYNQKTGEIRTHGDVQIVLVDPVSKDASK